MFLLLEIVLNSYQTSKRLFLPLSNAGLVKVEQRLKSGSFCFRIHGTSSFSECLLSAMALCSHAWGGKLLKMLLGVLMCLSVFRMEGWREPRWRTPLRKSSRRITAKWLWATDLSSRNWTECHPCFPELVLRDGTGEIVFFFFFCEGSEGSVLFYILLFFFFFFNC